MLRRLNSITEITQQRPPVETPAVDIPACSGTWSLFVEALIYVESGGDNNAMGKHNDGGCLQITPITVEDANRILGYGKYTLNDRFSREKSIEIFNAIQDYYNPERDLHFALKLWNPKAPYSYHLKVMRKYDELLNNKQL